MPLPRILHILESVRDLIKDPANHTTKTNARNQFGKVVSARGETATCFCLNGAIVRTTSDIEDLIYITELLEEHLPEDETDFIGFNDTHHHEEIIDLLDRSIKTFKERFPDCDSARKI